MNPVSLSISSPACLECHILAPFGSFIRLEADGLVRRRPSKEGRTIALHLTVSGQKLRVKLLADRRKALGQVMKLLSRFERDQLGVLLEKMLVGIKKDSLHAYAICRLCEEAVCAPCPMTMAIESER